MHGRQQRLLGRVVRLVAGGQGGQAGGEYGHARRAHIDAVAAGYHPEEQMNNFVSFASKRVVGVLRLMAGRRKGGKGRSNHNALLLRAGAPERQGSEAANGHGEGFIAQPRGDLVKGALQNTADTKQA